MTAYVFLSLEFSRGGTCGYLRLWIKEMIDAFCERSPTEYQSDQARRVER